VTPHEVVYDADEDAMVRQCQPPESSPVLWFVIGVAAGATVAGVFALLVAVL